MNKLQKSQSVSQEEMKALVVNQARKNLIDFEIATNPNYTPNWHHEIIAEELENIEKLGDKNFKILIVVVPPRHGKSQQCSIDFPAWFLGRNPTKEIITASYSGDLAQDFGTKTREKILSEEFQVIFPEVQIKEDEQAKGKWKTKKGGSYISVGVGGAITGRGADILIIDDPIKNREEAESEIYRNKIWDWFTSTAFTRLQPNGVVIIILTRWHLDDLAGRILKHSEISKRTKIIKFQAISQFKEKFRNENEALWKKQYPETVLEEIKRTIGPYDWSSLYMGEPILTENQEFKPYWIKNISEIEVERIRTRRFLTIDTAMSKKTYSDFTGFVDNRVDEDNFWHLKGWKLKLSAEELIEILFSLQNRNNYEIIGVEKTEYTVGLYPFLQEEQRKRNKFLPIVQLEHKQINKEIRIRAVIPRYAAGSIFHIDGECKALEDEEFSFPFGAHDDILDALAYQLQIANPPFKDEDYWNETKKEHLNLGR